MTVLYTVPWHFSMCNLRFWLCVKEAVQENVKIINRLPQHSRCMYSFSYIRWLQLAVEYGDCSQ